MINNELEKINQVVNSQTYLENKDNLLKWFRDQKLATYFLEKFSSQKPSGFNKLSFIFQAWIRLDNPFGILKFFETNVTEAESDYILLFLKDNFELINKDEPYDFYSHEAIKIAKKILKEFTQKADLVFEFVKAVFIQKGPAYKDIRSNRDHEKQVLADLVKDIFEIYQKQGEEEKIEEIVVLLFNNFDLISDESGMMLYTPQAVFSVFKDYINLSFERNFPKVVQLIVQQYQEDYDGKFNGWEWAGGGVSQSGDHFSAHDHHFVYLTLSPSLQNYYDNAKDKETAWNKIKNLCLARTENEVSQDKPDFLDRAIISIILERFKHPTISETKQESFDILKDFIEMRKGIPHKTDLIYQDILSSDISDEEKWDFVNLSINAPWNKNKIPVNVFVEKIVSDLASKGFTPANDLLSSWLKNTEYNERSGFFGNRMIENITKLVSTSEQKTQDEGITLFKEYIKSEAFTEKLERFEVFKVTELMAKLLEINWDSALSMLIDIQESKKLTVNQQLLLTSGINHIDQNKAELLLKTYNNYLEPLFRSLNNDVNRIVDRFSDDYAREALVEFGDKLAKAKYYEPSLNIAKIFMNDPDPRIENDEYDPEGKNNMHERVKKGESGLTITSVRGWVCWLLHEIPVLEGRDYIPQVIELVEKLSHDKNYYVRSQACFPLTQLATNRRAFMPGTNKEWFVDPSLADKIEGLALDMLRNSENQSVKAIMINLAHVFNYLRSLDQAKAYEALSIFKNNQFINDTIEHLKALFIFFAEFRKEAFQDSVWNFLGEFDQQPFKELLKNLLLEGSAEVRSNLSWQFTALIREAENEEKNKTRDFTYDRAFGISYGYLKVLIQKYDSNSFSHVMRFIEDNMDKKYDECLELFIEALNTESAAVLQDNKGARSMNFTRVAYYYHSQIINEIIKRGKKDDLVKVMVILSNYPEYSISWYDMKPAVEVLKTFPAGNQEVNKIFDNLIQRYPDFYDDKKIWLAQG